MMTSQALRETRRRSGARQNCGAAMAAAVGLFITATPVLAQEPAPGSSAVLRPAGATTAARIEQNRELAERKYGRQMTPRWQLGQPGVFVIEGKARSPWTITTWGPVNRESSFQTNGAPDTEYTGEWQMYWNKMPDFRIVEYQVWPNEQGWLARLIFAGTTKDGTPVRAHQVDIVTVDDTGKVTRIEYHCDAGEWIDQVWSKSSGLPAAKVREVLAQPKGWDRLVDIALGRAKP